MDSRRGKSRGKSNRPLKRSLRRAVAWLLVFCMCMANMNSAAFAAEIATASNALMAATPSDAKATDSDAMEILMPEEVISGEDLAAEAAQAISEGNEFDFDSEIHVKKDDQGKDEGYEELFKGRRSFVLFADNGNGGRIQGDNPNAYGYILVQVDEKDYEAFEKEAGEAKATDSNATDSDASERSWTLTGEEQVVFLYVNADDGSVTFTLNIENLQADDIVVPGYSELREEQKAEEEESREESEANNPATLPAEDGSENGGSAGGSGSGSGSAGSSDSADAEEPEKGTEDAAQAGGSDDGQGSGSGTEAGTEDSTDGAGQGSGEAGNSDSSDGAADTDKPDDSDGGQNSGQGSDKGDSAEDGDSSQSGSGSDIGSGDTDSGKAEGSGDAGSQKPDHSGDSQKPDSGNSSDSSNTGNGSDKGDSGNADKGDSGKGDSDKGDSGSSSSDKGSSDKGNTSSDKGNSSSSDKGNSSSSDKGNSSSDKEGSSDTAKLSKSSYDVPVVMGPNPNAEFESDEYGDMSFDEWQEMMEEAEEEEEDDEDYEDYIEETALAYEDGDGTTYFGMSMLPAVSATVKKEKKANPIARLLRMKAAAEETPAVVMAGTAALSELSGAVIGYHKTIEEKQDGNYRLHLDIAGRSTQGLDIILAVDVSGSMGNHVSGYPRESKLDVLKKTLNGEKGKKGFIEKMLEKYPYSRFSLVTFSTSGEQVEIGSDWQSSYWSSNLADIENAVNSLRANGGTNYEAGLWSVKEVLEERSDKKNIPVVLFLTDGKPTHYQYGHAEGFEYFGGNSYSGNGKTITEKTGDETIAVAGEFNDWLRNSENSALIYSVGFEMDDMGRNDYRNYSYNQYLSAIAEGITWHRDQNGKLEAPENSKRYIKVPDPEQGIEDLVTAFEQLEKRLALTDVTIHDSLSKYVDFAPEPNIKVMEINPDTGLKRELEEDTDYESLILDTEDKTVTLDFGSHSLEATSYYELSFDIVPSEEFDTILSGDLVKGDLNTDYDKSHIISSGKEGVYTNAEAYFSFGSEGINHVPYPRPVIPAEAVMYKPEHRKYIKANEDGTYDLTLNVTSHVKSEDHETQEKIPADILFVIDKSRSMKFSMDAGEYGQEQKYDNSRAKVVNEAMKGLIDKLDEKNTDGSEKYEVHFGGYKFSDELDWWDDYDFIGWDKADSAYKNLHLKYGRATDDGYNEVTGGTYPSGALKSAVATLEGRPENHKKYLIFLTDGDPSSYSEEDNVENALKGIGVQDLKIYAVRVTRNSGDSFMTGLVNAINNDRENKHYNVTAEKLNGNNKEELQESFDKIASDIIETVGNRTPGVTGVQIEDILSKYVTLLSGESEIKVLKDGIELDKTQIPYEVKVEEKNLEDGETTKQITVTFPLNYELEKDAVYSFSYRVEPSQLAIDEYNKNAGEENPYGTVGDPNTDAEGNDTSSKEPGFHSNESAKVTYTYDSRENTLSYPHPVIQVPQTGSFTVQKVIEGSDSKDGQKFIINIEQLVGGAPVPFSSVALAGNGEKSPAVQVDGEQQFKITEAVPMEYAFKEIRVIDENAEEADVTEAKFNSGTNTLTVASGDKLVVQVVNTFNHKGYFHSKAQVTNYTTGDSNTPFTSSPGKQAAEDMATAELAKGKVEIEQEEGDLSA